jgi:hypothetical protein
MEQGRDGTNLRSLRSLQGERSSRVGMGRVGRVGVCGRAITRREESGALVAGVWGDAPFSGGSA